MAKIGVLLPLRAQKYTEFFLVFLCVFSERSPLDSGNILQLETQITNQCFR